MDETDQLLQSILNGESAADASSQYLNSLLGIQPEQKAFPQMGHTATGMIGAGAARDGITDPSQIHRDENGFITGRGATFATQADLANYARTGSLATGDNGIGAWGHNTAATPGVAIPRDVLVSQFGSLAAARGRPVEVISPNGQTAVLPVIDVAPRLRNRSNNALIELTPSASQQLGSGDASGYRFRFL